MLVKNRLCFAVAVAAAASLAFALPAHAAVSGTAASGTPQLATTSTTQQVRQLVQCGGTMFAVGQFTQITHAGVDYSRNRAFSFSATSPFAVTSWDPNVNGRVDTIAFNGTDCASAYLGGTFTSVNGTTVKNLAKVSTSSGAVDTAFKNSAMGRVAHMEVVAGHLLVGGYFAGYLKSVSPTSGSPDGYGMPAISGTYSFPGVVSNPTRVWNMTVSPDRTAVLMMGDFTSVGGKRRQQIFRLNMTAGAATVSDWYSDGNPLNAKYKDGFNEECATVEPFWLQDAAWAPDMSMIYVATTGYKPYDASRAVPRSELCDAAAAFPATQSDVDPVWINYTGCDSLYTTAADSTAVYIGGHQRWASNPVGCDAKGIGGVDQPGMGSLSPATGAVLPNSPKRGRGLGADDMLVTSAGLWIASDNQGGTSMCAGQFGHAGICFLPY